MAWVSALPGNHHEERTCPGESVLLNETWYEKPFSALRWAPFGRRSAPNRNPPIFAKSQAYQVLRRQKRVGPLWTLIHSLGGRRAHRLIRDSMACPLRH